MRNSPSPWPKGAFFICEKCARRSDGPDVKSSYASDAKGEFKSAMKDAGKGKDIRVAVSSCLSLCTKKLQVAAYCPANGSMELVEYDPKADTEKLVSWLASR